MKEVAESTACHPGHFRNTGFSHYCLHTKHLTLTYNWVHLNLGLPTRTFNPNPLPTPTLEELYLRILKWIKDQGPERSRKGVKIVLPIDHRTKFQLFSLFHWVFGSLCNPAWLRTQDPSASDSRMLELYVCILCSFRIQYFFPEIPSIYLFRSNWKVPLLWSYILLLSVTEASLKPNSPWLLSLDFYLGSPVPFSPELSALLYFLERGDR